jgi:hypothetical protein
MSRRNEADMAREFVETQKVTARLSKFLEGEKHISVIVACASCMAYSLSRIPPANRDAVMKLVMSLLTVEDEADTNKGKPNAS